MDPSTIIEAVGYLGSILVLVSFLMTSVVKLRIVNTVGSLIFAVYALIIHSYPTAIMNFCLVLINIRFLLKLRSNKAPDYRLVSVGSSEGYVTDFLTQHREDIAACFPGRTWDPTAVNRAWLCCFGEAPAGLLMGTEENGVLNIALDYTTPAYRDCSVGKFLADRLPAQGISALRYARPEAGHVDYLEKMGYMKQGEEYRKEL